ncbi:DUF433 domain-containing protein [Paraflavitalea speifideaquila]|uniref:DUF433 domain-containing protein n=1 Tax=Paraflavitalea speifideaquila TaxID=3076558 RepID=UPI0028F03711|nr:DUF433 domain-containing protein [Paraflavitalea speifideiaquila]
MLNDIGHWEKDRHIVVDPHHQFGQPVIEKTNLLAETIYDLYNAGENKQFISRLYNVSVREINDAIDFLIITQLHDTGFNR